MNLKMIISLLLLNIFTTKVMATIYVGFSDPRNGDKALAVITSGPIDVEDRIISAEKNKGLIGWSGGGRVSSKADQLIFKMMNDKRSASDIEAQIEANYPDQYYRLVFVTPEGEVGSLVPKNGCPELECGKREAADFVVIGGGLETQVLEKTLDEFGLVSIQSQKQTACKMLEILSYITKIGGEKKEFTSAQIVIDSKSRDQLLRANSFKSMRHYPEERIIQNLSSDLSSKGVNCSIP
ncbi:MAG: DUF1028 domain-containing protein [Bacteriovorax sp.]